MVRLALLLLVSCGPALLPPPQPVALDSVYCFTGNLRGGESVVACSESQATCEHFRDLAARYGGGVLERVDFCEEG